MLNEWRFVIAAYAITWVVAIGYAAYIEVRWRRVRQASGGGVS